MAIDTFLSCRRNPADTFERETCLQRLVYDLETV